MASVPCAEWVSDGVRRMQYTSCADRASVQLIDLSGQSLKPFRPSLFASTQLRKQMAGFDFSVASAFDTIELRCTFAKAIFGC